MNNLSDQLHLLTATFIEKDEKYRYLSGTGKNELEARFMTKIGNRRIDLLNLQLEIKAVQRKIEELTAAINRKEVPSIALINAKVLVEMTEAREAILKQKEQVVAAQDYLKNLVFIADPTELKETYRQLAKKLHPDVVAENTEQLQELWLRVRDAYVAGDIDTLKSIEIVYADVLAHLKPADEQSEEELQKKVDFLKESIRSLDGKIAALKNSFPYTIETLLNDDDLIAAETSKTEEEIDQHEIYHQELIAKFEKMIHDHGGQ